MLKVAAAAALTFALMAAGSPTRNSYPRERLSLVLPTGWHITTARINGVVDPVTLFTATRFRLRHPAASPGICSRTLQQEWRADGAYVHLAEERDGASRRRMLQRVSPRPRRFDLSGKGAGGLCTPPNSGEIPFQERGRAFYLFYGIGTKASAATRAAAQRLVDSLRIEPRP